MRTAVTADSGWPPELDALGDLFAREKITRSEFAAARAYLQMPYARRAEVDAQINDVHRAILANLVLKQMTPGAAVYAATACHPGGILWRIREALDTLGAVLAVRG
jgi:hypothetical protein